ncbi:hypothetical protein WA026_010236 [Henosepilachna vigintioctopunctata]|uniref:Succinate-semialdehyde dehydrogenase, mitochondrial n=1 Tax=Henosepilachna vigintioctopunctata TaxID=420089 RepID=A0AAW1UJR3_9CUCU
MILYRLNTIGHIVKGNSSSVIMNQLRKLSHLHLIKQRAYVDGKWVGASTEKVFQVSNPANGEILSEIPDMNEKDVEAATKAALTAFKKWSNIRPYDRSKLMRNWFDLMVKNQETLAQIITLEGGKPYAESVAEVNYGNSYIEFYAEEAKRINGEIISGTQPTKQYFVTSNPIGVVGLITSFNFPLAMITRKLSAALAAGCTCIIKPSTDTPLTALAMAELAHQAGIPKGVVNVITGSHGSNASIVGYLCSNPDVKGISFTGSVEVGKIINERCAPNIKRVCLELGGNAPFIVYNSANVANAVQSAISSKFRCSGQACVAPNRFLVQDGIYDCFIENLLVEIGKLKMGDGSHKDVKVGPLINVAQVEKIRHLVEDAVSKGANVLIGGRKAPLVGDLFYEPTVITDIRETMHIYREEIFGPVISILKFRTEEESLLVANQTDLGLAGYIFSGDINQIFRVSKELEVGMVGVNEGIISAAEIPFGGIKSSGIGREGGHHGLREFLDYKYICVGNLN